MTTITAAPPHAKDDEEASVAPGDGAAQPSPPPPPPSPEDLKPTEKVGLRVPRRLVLVAKTKWANGGSRVQPECQDLLERALRARADEAHGRAVASVLGTIAELGEPLEDLPQVRYDDVVPLTVQLSPYALQIAENLGRRKGGSLSIQKVCEPLLSAELRSRRQEAVRAARAILEALEQPDEPDCAP